MRQQDEVVKPRNYSVNGALIYANVGRTTFYDALAKGNLRAIKCGRRTLVPVAELDRWMDSMPAYR